MVINHLLRLRVRTQCDVSGSMQSAFCKMSLPANKLLHIYIYTLKNMKRFKYLYQIVKGTLCVEYYRDKEIWGRIKD